MMDMMSRQLFSLVFAMVLLCPNGVHAQKKVYIPKELRGMDLENDTSRWSFQRSIETPSSSSCGRRGSDKTSTIRLSWMASRWLSGWTTSGTGRSNSTVSSATRWDG